MSKKYLSLDRLTEYDTLIKQEISEGDLSTLSSSKSYTDSKMSELSNGTTIIKEAEHASNADSAISADSATKATQDGNGNVITDTYALVGHEHSWEELNDKPFGEETTISEIVIVDTEHDFTTGALYVDNLYEVEQNKPIAITIDENEYTAMVYYEGRPIYEYYLDGFSDGCPLRWEIGNGLIDNSGTLGAVNIKISNQSTSTTVKTLDEKYLPTLVGKATEEGGEIFNYYLKESSNSNFAGRYAHAEGYNTHANGDYSHTEGNDTSANEYSHAEGFGTTASGGCSHAEGRSTTASGDYSHAEGENTTASGDYSHAEGYNTESSGTYSHAEGYRTESSGTYSHAEGAGTTASGWSSHAEGENTTASGKYSHVEGENTIASGKHQHVQGRWNIDDVDSDGNALNTYAHIVGNGTADYDRSNAHTLDWNGNAWYQGNVYVGGTSQDDGSKLVTETEVDTKLANKSDKTHNHDDVYETKTDAQTKLDEAKEYADTAANTVKNDLLNGAGDAYDTLKELGDLINTNVDAIEALETVATGKADKSHGHTISDVTDLQTTLDEISLNANESDVFIVNVTENGNGSWNADKTFDEVLEAYNNGKLLLCKEVNSTYDTYYMFSHYNYQTYGSVTIRAFIFDSYKVNTNGIEKSSISIGDSSVSPVKATFTFNDIVNSKNVSSLTTTNKTISGAINEIQTTLNAKASQSDLDALEEVVDGKSNTGHGHAISEITDLQTTLSTVAEAISANTNSISNHSTAISNLQAAISEIEEITSEEIKALFA